MTAQPTVAIVSDNALQRHRLQQAVGKYGLKVIFIGAPERYLEREGLTADLWIVELDDEETHPELLDELLSDEERTILFGLGKAPEPGNTEHARWERRLFSKLEDRFGELEQLDTQATLEALDDGPQAAEKVELSPWIKAATPGKPAETVWVLGASLGGPAAVKTFLDSLPEGLPVGFVYAQHIDANFTQVLTRVLARHAHYKLVDAEEGQPLRCGEIVFVPVERELYLDEDGLIRFKETPWPGPYGPSIDQVMLNVANHYQQHCHTILFSGMGNDGAIAAPLLKAYGSRIWVQDSESCANSSMPDSVAATGATEFRGPPDELARKLVRCVEENCLLSRKSQRDSA